MLNIQAGTISRCHKYLDKIGSINQQSVQNLPEDVKGFLRQVTPKRLKELAQMNCFAADKLKSEMDKTYGASNYVIIAIGRSISSIAETLCKMGVEVKILPLSRLKRFDINFSEWDDFSWNARQCLAYKVFLACSQNLSKFSLEQNKNKKYILMDFAYTGGSIKKAEELFQREDFFDNAPNLSSKKINDALGKDFYNRGYRTLFFYNRFKNFSYVGEFNIGVEDSSKLYAQASPDTAYEYQGNITQGLRKLFWFNVFDSMHKQDYKDILPKNELKAINQHNLSQKVVQNYIKKKEKENQVWINALKKENAPKDKIDKYQDYHSKHIQNYIQRIQEERQLLMTALESDNKHGM